MAKAKFQEFSRLMAMAMVIAVAAGGIDSARAAEPTPQAEKWPDGTGGRMSAPLYEASAAAHDAMVGYPKVMITDMEISPTLCVINGAMRPEGPTDYKKLVTFKVRLTPTADRVTSMTVEGIKDAHARSIVDGTLNELGIESGGQPGKPRRAALTYVSPEPATRETPPMTSDKPWRVIEGHKGSVMAVGFALDGRTLASTGRDSNIILWDVEAGREAQRLTGPVGSVYVLLYSPDGSLLAAGGDDRKIRLWSVPGYELAQTIETDHSDPVRGLSFTPDGRTLASCSMDRTVKLWNLADGKLIRTMTGHVGALKAVMFSPDGRQLMSAGQERGVRVWDAATGDLVRELTSPEPTHEAAVWSPDGRWIAANGTFGPRVIWEAETGRPWRRVTEHVVEGDSMAFAPGGGLLAAGYKDQMVDLQDTGDWRLVGRLITDKGRIESLAFTPDGGLLACGGNDHKIRVWNLAELGLTPKAAGQTAPARMPANP